MALDPPEIFFFIIYTIDAIAVIPKSSTHNSLYSLIPFVVIIPDLSDVHAFTVECRCCQWVLSLGQKKQNMHTNHNFYLRNSWLRSYEAKRLPCARKWTLLQLYYLLFTAGHPQTNPTASTHMWFRGHRYVIMQHSTWSQNLYFWVNFTS